VVGYHHHDDGRLRRYDAQDVRRNVCRFAVCAHRRTYDSTSGSGDRIELRPVLLAHEGARQAAQEAAPRAARRGRQTQGRVEQARRHATERHLPHGISRIVVRASVAIWRRRRT